MLEQLDYSLSISMRDSWLGLRPRQQHMLFWHIESLQTPPPVRSFSCPWEVIRMSARKQNVAS